MSRKCPYLHRRGDTLYFRISVPARFRHLLGVREITKTLRTQNKQDAIPSAYRLASNAKALFLSLDSAMAKKTPIDPYKARKAAKQVDSQKVELITFVDLFGNQSTVDTGTVEDDIKAMNALLGAQKRLIDDGVTPAAPVVAPVAQNIPQTGKGPLLSKALEAFRESLKGSSKAQDKKNRSEKWGMMFVEFVGDKPIDTLHPNDPIEFLLGIGCHPANDKQYKGLSVREKIAECRKNNDKTINESTWKGAYRTPLAAFLKHLRLKYGREYDIAEMSISDADYHGNQKKGANAQRHLERAEVRTLVASEQMEGFASDPAMVHVWWFVMLALHSGARLEELSTLHPVLDVRLTECGQWFIEIVADEKAGVNGRVVDAGGKGSKARLVPVHHLLIEKGFVEYVERRRAIDDGLLFPFTVRGNSNSSNAGRMIEDLMRDTGLRGVGVKGAHAFRKTFISLGGECAAREFEGVEGSIIKRQELGRSELSEIVGHTVAGASRMTNYYAKTHTAEMKRRMADEIVLYFQKWVNLLDYEVADCLPLPVLPDRI